MDADKLLAAYTRGLIAFEPWAKRLAILTWIAFIIYVTVSIIGSL